MNLHSSFWNQRYAGEEYIYGKTPNQFFKSHIDRLEPGKVLLPAEGEGRNAVYAASLGWEVFAFDNSSQAIEKAQKLAFEAEVNITYEHSDFEHYQAPHGDFDVIAWLYAHMNSQKRRQYHRRISKFLKPGGLTILEAFNADQLNFFSGGPKSLDMLYNEADLRVDFESFHDIDILEGHVYLKEGKGHEGLGSVIRLVAKK